MMHSRRLFPVAWAVAAVVALFASLVSAQPADPSAPIVADEANRLFREGREDFNAGQFKDAHRKYSTAWRLRKSPDIAANIGQTELELGMFDQAAMHFSYALANLLPSTSREQRVALEEALAKATGKLGELVLDVAPADVVVTIDGEPVDQAFVKTGVFVPPGEHVVVATADGYVSAEREIVAVAGEMEKVALHLVPVAGARDAEADHPSRFGKGQTVAIITGSTLAVLGFGVGVGYLVRSEQRNRDAEALRDQAIEEVGQANCPREATEGTCGELWDTLLAQGRSRNTAVGGFVAGGVFTVATVVSVLAWPKSVRPTANALSVGVSGGVQGARVTIGGRF